MGKRSVENPCIKVCAFDAAGVCRGCFRTRTEARAWKGLSDPEKEAINRRVRPLMSARKGGKRLRKIDRRIRKLEAKLEALRAERLALVPGAT